MIARTRLSSVGQVAGAALAALVCYLVSQTVASERAALAKVDRQIADARDAIARLETEIGVRSRQPQLERWNGQVLSLHAPKPRQFVTDSVQLVSEFSVGAARPALPLNPAITSQQAVTKVSYQPVQPREPAPATLPPAPVSAPEPAAAQPLLRTATFVRAKVDRLAPETAEVVKASYRPAAPSLLPADIGRLAAAEKEQAKSSKGSAGADRR